MRNLLPYYFLIAISILISGCALKAEVVKIAPAKDGEIMKYRKVAVLNFTTDNATGNKGAGAYASAFEKELASVTVGGKKVFTVIDRSNIDKILKEQKFQMTMTDEDSALELGKILGVNAIWTGTAAEDYSKDSWYETDFYCAEYDNGSCISYRHYSYKCIGQDLALNIMPKLTDVSTTKVIYSNSFKGRTGSKKCASNLGEVNRGDLWNQAIKMVLEQFRQEIAPYTVKATVEFMTSASHINTKEGKKLLKNGIEFFKNKRIDKACELWKKGAEISPISISLNYNAGICAEIEGNYKEAVEKLIYTENIRKKYNKTISEALNRNKENVINQETVQKQLGK